MKFGMIGSGAVGQAIGGKLVSLGHEVKIAGRDPKNPKTAEWAKTVGPKASVGTFAEAAQFGEMLFNCTAGLGSHDALKAAGADNLNGKVLIDVSNPLDFTHGFPPTLSVLNADSLAEQIQRNNPGLKVVKALNTLTNTLMIDPQKLANGDHDLPICGNDAEAKAKVSALLETFGWKKEHLIDMGDLSAARGTEAWLLLWTRMYAALKTPDFNFKIIR